MKNNTPSKKTISLEASPHLPTKYGEFQAFTYKDNKTGAEHIALVSGIINPKQAVNIRVHSECLTGDTLGSLKCDCGAQLDFALNYIAKNGGIVLYLHDHEGRSIGLVNKMKAYELQEQGFDTVEANLKLGLPADNRDYSTGAQILYDLGARKINILTNNPDKITGLAVFGLEIVKRIPIDIPSNKNNGKYLNTKRDKMGHLLSKY